MFRLIEHKGSLILLCSRRGGLALDEQLGHEKHTGCLYYDGIFHEVIDSAHTLQYLPVKQQF